MLGKFRKTLKPIIILIAKPIAATGLNPNVFSFSGIPLALISANFILQKNFALAFLFALTAVSIDLFDGSVARLQGKNSLFGNYFETIIDKIVEVILFIGTAFLHPLASICALAFSMLVSYAKPRVALVIITDNRDWPALGEHSERMLLLLLGLFFSIFGLKFFGFEALELFLWLITITSLIGFAQRLNYAKKLIEEAEKTGNILPYLKK